MIKTHLSLSLSVRRIRAMLTSDLIQAHLGTLQYFVAVIFVPLVCWQKAMFSSKSCRWSALLGGYGIQLGLFLLLDDAGFRTSTLILFCSVAAYVWVTYSIKAWPSTSIKKINKVDKPNDLVSSVISQASPAQS